MSQNPSANIITYLSVNGSPFQSSFVLKSMNIRDPEPRTRSGKKAQEAAAEKDWQRCFTEFVGQGEALMPDKRHGERTQGFDGSGRGLYYFQKWSFL